MTGTRSRRAVILALGALALLGLVLLPGAASAKKRHKHPRKPGIYVSPGPDAITNAIARARPGQTIRIRKGRYHEAVVIDKPLRLIAANKILPIIDGDCDTQYTVDVRSANVILRRLKVVGADEGHGPLPAEVNLSNIDSGTARDVIVRDTCDAEYGINVFGSGPVQILSSEARGGFSDAGIYIGGISNTLSGALRVRGNISFGNNRGVIIEDTLASTDVRVTGNSLFDNDIPPGEGEPSGIFLHRSDGVMIFGNRVHDNAHFGIHLDEQSDFNQLLNNVVSSNPVNFLAQGLGNCGSGNTGFTVPAC